MTAIDQAKQILYMEENRAYRNAFKLDLKPVQESLDALGSADVDKAESMPVGGWRGN